MEKLKMLSGDTTQSGSLICCSICNTFQHVKCSDIDSTHTMHHKCLACSMEPTQVLLEANSSISSETELSDIEEMDNVSVEDEKGIDVDERELQQTFKSHEDFEEYAVGKFRSSHESATVERKRG